MEALEKQIRDLQVKLAQLQQRKSALESSRTNAHLSQSLRYSAALVMRNDMLLLTFYTGLIPLVLSVPCKYYLIQQGETWSDAQAYCRVNHTDLAIIEGDDNMIRLQNEAQRQHLGSSVWIGLYNDINSWRWSYANEPLGSMRPWHKGEPNNSGGRQLCGAMSKVDWWDKTCTDPNPFICFNYTETGAYNYIYISNAMSWYKAQMYCRTHYIDLASSKDTAENSIMLGLVNVYAWIGLFRDSWKWIDQNNFTTYPISWMPGKPDNGLGNENCGYLNNSEVADAQCSGIMPFFCYSVITGQQQIIRVTVQSNQDVNGPAVKVSILEQ
ncbi:putative C-type lectin domain family 20 member A isoform X1, partial [Clarias magur]